MTDISVGNGQGITQAIASKLGLSKSDCKNIKASTWQSVMTLVNQANTASIQNNKGSIFGGGNNVNNITNKASWKTDFKVQAGQTMQIDDSIFGKIKQLLTAATDSASQAAATVQTQQAAEASQVSQTTQTQKAEQSEPVVKSPGVVDSSGVYRTQTPVLVADTPLEGDAKTGKAAADTLDNMLKTGTGEINFTSEEWRELAAKPNKTPEEVQKLNTEYNNNIQKLGNSMTKYISESFANGGDIDSAAFMKFQNNGAMNLDGLTAEEKAMLETSNQTAFNRIDVNGDGKIDNKEMTAFMHALDFDDKNRMGGVIKAEDYYNCASQLDDPNENLLDTKINYCYNKLYGSDEE